MMSDDFVDNYLDGWIYIRGIPLNYCGTQRAIAERKGLRMPPSHKNAPPLLFPDLEQGGVL